jgi:hypothetical protein
MLSLAAVALIAAYAFLAPPLTPREPFDDAGCELESVMVIGSNTMTYALEPPYRVLRNGQVTVNRPNESPSASVVRMDLSIGGDHVVIFARPRE